MKTYVIIFSLAVVVTTTLAYNYTTYKNEIENRCLTQLRSPTNMNGQISIGGLTMESFISMVEKVERNHTDWDIYQVSRALLRRFAFDGIVYKELNSQRSPIQQPEHRIRWEIIRDLVVDGNNGDPNFREEDLNEEEKCTMFFMMGHIVNDTFREGIDDESQAFIAPLPADSSSNDYLRSPRSKASKFPREQGVVSLRGETERAIAVGKILNAILASRSPIDLDITEVFAMKDDDLTRGRKLNTLIGVTLADVVSYGAIHHKLGTSGLKFFGPGGSWNSSLCPTEFTLNENSTGATNALLRGAIDGFQIGRALQKLPNFPNQNIRLSRILRMYYSKAGIPTDSPSQGVSFCSRQEVLRASADVLTESFNSFYLVHNYKELQQLPDDLSSVNTAYTHLTQAVNILDDLEKDYCRSNGFEQDNYVCETPSNTFVILDESELHTEGFVEQETIVGYLAHNLDIGVGAGSISVFTASRHSGGELKPVYYNATNPSCAACQTARIDKRKSASNQENTADILEAINKTLQHFELKTDLLPAVPNKVVIWFHYADFSEKDNNRLKKAAQLVRHGHRDSRLLVVGSIKISTENLKLISTTQPDAISLAHSETTSRLLAQRICQVPAVLQYNQCWNSRNRNEESHKFSGYVSSGAVQFWAMYPEYFLKSFDLEFKFKAESGNIKVCSQRGDPNPGFSGERLSNDKICQTTDNSKRELIFRFKDPCHKFDVNSCQPINFAVIGVANAANDNRQFHCPKEDSSCRRLDQNAFVMTHKGISCSGCDFFKASPLLMLVIFIGYFFTKSS